jgi:hypothetical protein
MDIKRFNFTSAVSAMDYNHVAVPLNLVTHEPYLVYFILPSLKNLDDIVRLNESIWVSNLVGILHKIAIHKRGYSITINQDILDAALVLIGLVTTHTGLTDQD